MFQLGHQCLAILFIIINVITCQNIHDGMDILSPYLSHHGPKHRSHRDTQACQSVRYRNVTHSLHQAFENETANLPVVQSYRILKEIGTAYWNKRTVFVLHQVVNNPLSTVSVLEPGYLGSCLNESGTRATVRETAQRKKCIYASNAGYFNTHNGHCFGNVVSDGKFVHNSVGIQNAHFGVTKDGKLFTGYLSELDYLSLGFKQLVGGVIWLVRDGENYVDESMKVECSNTEETGSIQRFVNVISARTAIGHDEAGKVHIVQVNGWSDHAGVDLHEFADLLVSLGIVSAINLDGGGSATSIINGTLVNYPSDICPDKINNCEREVSTIICVHYTECSPVDCSNHGVCDKGKCHCDEPWMGDGCEIMDKTKCGHHGKWIQNGCSCEAGWHGPNCSSPCLPGWYGHNCNQQCLCSNHGNCSRKTGECRCQPGYTGKFCQQKCPYGFYGHKCVNVCFCQDSCFCDHVTGSCNVTHHNPDYMKAGDCLIKQAIERDNLVPDRQEQYSICISSVACLSIIATASLILNALMAYLVVKWRRDHQENSDSLELSPSLLQPQKQKRFKRRKKRPRDRVNNQYHALNGWADVGGKGDATMFFEREKKRNGMKMSKGNDDKDNEDVTVTGSGEDENDLFLAKKKSVF